MFPIGKKTKKLVADQNQYMFPERALYLLALRSWRKLAVRYGLGPEGQAINNKKKSHGQTVNGGILHQSTTAISKIF